jgi:thymidylate synthase
MDYSKLTYGEYMQLSGENHYLALLKDVLENGNQIVGRNGTVISKFSAKIDFDIRDSFPLLTTKQVYWKGVCEELLWFIGGNTDAKLLAEKKVHIWDGNSTREFLDGRGLTHYRDGELGPVYGWQWRHFNSKYIPLDRRDSDYKPEGVDQLKNCIDLIKNDPMSRRIFMTAWNPCQIEDMALPPCHISYNFYVDICPVTGEKLLSTMMYQRSADLFLGVPFNIASTALLTYMIAHVTGCIPNKISIAICNAHIYGEHIDAVKEQLKRIPIASPKLIINRKVENIDSFRFEDFTLEKYYSHPSIKAKMIA